MKRYKFKVIFLFSIMLLMLSINNVHANLPLSGKVIVIDPGHGAKDPGTIYHNIYEKDINLNISLYLEKELIKHGATVILTRDSDYDLSSPNANFRKKSDFDNRIKLINDSRANMYVSIHLNYLNDITYKGAQVFYNNDSKYLATVIQDVLNNKLDSNRKIKLIPNSTYMYKKIHIKGVLIECGFLSNPQERELLITQNYQKEIASAIELAIEEYYK